MVFDWYIIKTCDVFAVNILYIESLGRGNSVII